VRGATSADGNGHGGSNHSVECFGTEDEPMHSQTSWTEPWQGALPPPAPGAAWDDLPPPPTRSRIVYGGRERPLLGTKVKQEMHEERGSSGWENQRVKKEYKKIKPDLDSDDDSESDFKLKDRSCRGAPTSNSSLARPVGTRDAPGAHTSNSSVARAVGTRDAPGYAWRGSAKDYGWKVNHYGKGDVYKGTGKGYVKEELGEDPDRRFGDMDAEENGVAW